LGQAEPQGPEKFDPVHAAKILSCMTSYPAFVKSSSARPYHVYAVELGKGALKRKTDLASGKTPVYVGMSAHAPADRFAKHKAGVKANNLVNQHGVKLLPELYEQYNPMPYQSAFEKEQALAKELKDKGYIVFGGNPPAKPVEKTAGESLTQASPHKAGMFGSGWLNSFYHDSKSVDGHMAQADFVKKYPHWVKRASAVDDAITAEPKGVVNIPNDVVPLRTRKEYLDYLQKYEHPNFISTGFNKHVAYPVMLAMKSAIRLPAKTGNPYAMVIDPKFERPSVIKHELGHVTDFKAKGITDQKTYKKYLGHQISLFNNPKNLRRYQLEENAWNNTDVPKDSLIRQLALESYQKSLNPFWYYYNKVKLNNTEPEKQADWKEFDEKRKKDGIPVSPDTKRVIQKLKDPKREGLVLYHPPGSGKTRQAIEAYQALGMKTDAIVPAALKENLRGEFRKWTGEVPSNLNIVSQQRMANQRLKTPLYNNGFQIIDEAQRARNPDSQLYQALQNTRPAKRLALSGTPLWSTPGDLSSLVNLVSKQDLLPTNPKKFRDRYFKEEQVQPGLLGRLTGVKPGIQYTLQNRAELSKILKKYVDYIPPTKKGYPAVTNEDVKVPMSGPQQDIYNSLLNQAGWITKYRVKHNLPAARGGLDRLKAFLVGPRMVSNSTVGYTVKPSEMSSPKIDAAFDYFKKHHDADPAYRALVYSDFLQSLNQYKHRLDGAHIPYGEFSGQVPQVKRNQMLKAYNSGKLPIMMLSPSASEGLTALNTSLFQQLTPTWSFAKDQQIVGRGIRLGSHKDLPPDKQKILVQRYYATPKPTFFDRLTGNGNPTGVDQYVRNTALRKQKMNDAVTDLIAQPDKPDWKTW
jgi:hypothetical protein